MPDWILTSFSNGTAISPLVLVYRIGLALVLGAIVATVYRWAKRGETVPPSFIATLILLSTIIAMSTQVIGDNIARAFSLVGALSVVRFRTVVKDTQDTAFVIFAVVVGMAAGGNHLLVAFVGIGLVIAIAPFLWPIHRPDAWQVVESTLSLRMRVAASVPNVLETLLNQATTHSRLYSVGTAKGGASVDYSYHVRLRPTQSPTDLIAELNKLEWVDSVELRHRD